MLASIARCLANFMCKVAIMKKALYLLAIAICGCGGQSSETVFEPNNTIDNTSGNTTTQQSNNSTTNTPGTNTGSSLVADVALLAQANPHDRYMPHKQVTELFGTDTEAVTEIGLTTPPHEISPCYGAVMLSNTVPVMDSQYQYNGWWLMASLTNTKTYQIETQPQLYWATQLSDTEVGVVPTNVTISGTNTKIQTDFGTFPYYYVSRLGYIAGFPVNPDEPCEKQ